MLHLHTNDCIAHPPSQRPCLQVKTFTTTYTAPNYSVTTFWFVSRSALIWSQSLSATPLCLWSLLCKWLNLKHQILHFASKFPLRNSHCFIHIKIYSPGRATTTLRTATHWKHLKSLLYHSLADRQTDRTDRHPSRHYQTEGCPGMSSSSPSSSLSSSSLSLSSFLWSVIFV